MARSTQHSAVWALVRRQHGVVARWQLLRLGFTPEAIDHRLRIGRLHPIRRGVYAVGRSEVSFHGSLIGGVLAAGPDAVLSHTSAGALWRITDPVPGPLHVSIPQRTMRTGEDLVIHRRPSITAHTAHRHHVPVTSPALTIIDLATLLNDDELEAAVNAADQRSLIDPENLRRRLDQFSGRRGVARLRRLLDHHTRADTHLERRFLRLVGHAGLPTPLTQQWLLGRYRVDFLWRDHNLVVETDGLTYHRTPAAQTKDRVRDQDLLTAGYTVIRFTHAQVITDPDHVTKTLQAALSTSCSSPTASRNATGSNASAGASTPLAP
jgi:very-short-patch-repair endonuclease